MPSQLTGQSEIWAEFIYTMLSSLSFSFLDFPPSFFHSCHHNNLSLLVLQAFKTTCFPTESYLTWSDANCSFLLHNKILVN